MTKQKYFVTFLIMFYLLSKYLTLAFVFSVTVRSDNYFTHLDDCQGKLANGKIIDFKSIDNPAAPMYIKILIDIKSKFFKNLFFQRIDSRDDLEYQFNPCTNFKCDGNLTAAV